MLGQAACQWDTGPTVASVGTETWTLPQQISRTPGYLGNAVQGRAEAYLCCVASGRAARRRARSCPGTESASPSLPAPGRPRRAPGRQSHPPLSDGGGDLDVSGSSSTQNWLSLCFLRAEAHGLHLQCGNFTPSSWRLLTPVEVSHVAGLMGGGAPARTTPGPWSQGGSAHPAKGC